jgi:[CysO sulfur-carrier protein]-S-L-cysteine hydrolase
MRIARGFSRCKRRDRVSSLSLTTGVCLKLAEACERALPREACGFLLGAVEGGGTIVTEFVLALESRSRSDSFAIPDHELRRMAAYAEDRRLRIIALFHSHPSGDNGLSPGDRAALRYSAWPWVIVTRWSGEPVAGLTGYARGDATTIAVEVGLG